MPYMVIYVPDESDVESIVFNELHGNSQGIGDSGNMWVPFDIVDIRSEPPGLIEDSRFIG